tara:strand:+ start:936 stop:1616 length:681 start_codon:yes stop_codon:yes gene_type:complete
MNKKKVIIITPSYRIKNLNKILQSISFDHIYKWIIIYDGSKISENFEQFKNNKNIVEIVYISQKGEIQGNAQRNKGLDYVSKNFSDQNIFIYFLDDDNIVNPNFYKLLRDIKINYFYTFDQQRNRYVFSGENPKVYQIDLGMFLFDFKLANDIRFRLDKYEADGIYVEDCCNKDIKKHIYVPNIYTYYNYLGRNLVRRSYYRFFWFIRHFLSNNFKLFKIVKQKKP